MSKKPLIWVFEFSLRSSCLLKSEIRLPHTSMTAHLRVYAYGESVTIPRRLRILTSLSSCLTSSVICLMTSRGASSDSLTINAETDLGPRVSLLLNSLLLRSLNQVNMFSKDARDGPTSKFHQQVAGNRTARTECAKIRPSALLGARNMTNFE